MVVPSNGGFLSTGKSPSFEMDDKNRGSPRVSPKFSSKRHTEILGFIIGDSKIPNDSDDRACEIHCSHLWISLDLLQTK